MIYIAPTFGKNQSVFLDGLLGCGKSRLNAGCLKAMSHLQSWTEGGKVFQILEAETQKALVPKLRFWRGTDKVAECINLVGLWCCKSLARYGGEPACIDLCVKVAILNHICYSIGSQRRIYSKAEEEEEDIWEMHSSSIHTH